MIGAGVVEAAGEKSLFVPLGVHDPEGRHFSDLASAEGDPVAGGRFARAKIPRGRIAMCEAGDGSVPGIQAAYLSAAAGEFWFPIAVKMIGVGTIGLEFPGYARARQKL